jgi:hypothetical protein
MVFPESHGSLTSSKCNPTAASPNIVKGGHGFAFKVKKGEQFRIVDLYGEQVVDFLAWVQNTNLTEKVSMAYTRYHLNGVQPAVGECLWSNGDRELLRVVDDTAKVHDMTFMCCNPGLYEKKGVQDHRACATNIAEVMQPHGLGSWLDVPDPFNIFQNTPNYTLKRLGTSKPGDYIQFEALVDLICAVSCCPYGKHFLALIGYIARPLTLCTVSFADPFCIVKISLYTKLSTTGPGRFQWW